MVAGWLQAAVVIVAVIALHVPLGDYMARTFSSGRHWRAEMVLYRCCGIDPDADQRWPDYLRSLAAHAAMEGKQTAFGVPGSALFGVAATSTADGAADASYDSFTSLGGGMLLSAMMLGEISPGGVGSGLYGLLMVVLIAVFLGGLMISRTPEYLRKRIRAPEMKMIALYYLTTPIALLAGASLAIALPAGRAAILNPGAHGLSEVVYAFTSAANSNGSAFAGLSGNTTFYNVALAVVMLLGRYLHVVIARFLFGRNQAERLLQKLGSFLATRAFVAFGLDPGFALRRDGNFD